MYPLHTDEVARQRRQAYAAAAVRRRSFGRARRAAGADVPADTTPLAHLVALPVRRDGIRDDVPGASAARQDPRVA